MKRKLLTVAILALAGIALYTTAGFLIAPRILERELETMVREDTDLDLATEAVAVNPFTLALSLDNVTLFRRESTPVASIQRLEGRIRGIRFRERSLVLRDVIVHEIEIGSDDARQPVLSAPLVTAPHVILGSNLEAVAAETPRFEQAKLRLERGADGTTKLPALLQHLISLPSPEADSNLFRIAGGSLTLVDRTLAAPFKLHVEAIDGTLEARRPGQRLAANLSLRGRLTEGGSIRLIAEWMPARMHEQTRIDLDLQGIDLPEVSPYVAAVTERAVVSGRMDMAMQLSIDGGLLDIDSESIVEDLAFEQSIEGDTEQGLLLSTAAALLEDENGSMEVEVGLGPRRIDAGADIASLYAGALTERIESLGASPFMHLAELAGVPDADLERLAFPPGSAEIRGDAADKLAMLGRLLERRPRLALTVYPALDPDADRRALARQQIVMHVNWATSAGIPGQPVSGNIDFEDLIVRDVLEEFATNRLPPARQAALAELFSARDTPYYRAVFEALVDNEDVAVPTLERLARYRAQSVVDELAGDKYENRIRQAGEIRYSAAGASTPPQVVLEVRDAGR